MADLGGGALSGLVLLLQVGEDVSRAVLMNDLESEGAEVVGVADADRAIDALRQYQFSAAIFSLDPTAPENAVLSGMIEALGLLMVIRTEDHVDTTRPTPTPFRQVPAAQGIAGVIAALSRDGPPG